MSDRVRDAFGALMERMEDPPTWEDVSVPVARPQPRSRRPLLAVVSAVAAVVVVGILATLWPRPVTYQWPTAEVLPGEEVVSESPLVVIGVPGAEPRFDTSTLGDEVGLGQVTDVGEFQTWAVQLELDGSKPVKVIVGGQIDTGASVGLLLGDPQAEGSGGIKWCLVTVTENGQVCSGRPDFEEPVFSIHHPAPNETGTLAWGPAPTGTSVVTLSYGNTTMWQKPVSGLVLFPLQDSPARFVITALDADGNQIHTDSPKVEPTTPELGIGHLWPPQPMKASPVDLSVRFVEETLGWDNAGGSLFSDSDPAAEARVRVKQTGVSELVDVISVPSGDGRVVVEVGPPWAMGADVHSSQDGGTIVSLLSIGDGIVGQATLQLQSGGVVSASSTIRVGASEPAQVVFPEVDPVSVSSVLIRYFDSNGDVIAANGDGRPPFIVDHG